MNAAACKTKWRVIALWSFGLLSMGETTLSTVSVERSPTGLKTSTQKRWEVVTPEMFF